VAGVVAGALLVGGVVALAPGPATSPTLAPTGAPAASVTPGTSTEAPSGSADPSGDTGVVVGLPAPALVVPQFAGGTIDLAALRGRPVHVWIDRDGIVRQVATGAIDAAEMASGLGSILRGVAVTP
jgi:hypothetical protein